MAPSRLAYLTYLDTYAVCILGTFIAYTVTTHLQQSNTSMYESCVPDMDIHFQVTYAAQMQHTFQCVACMCTLLLGTYICLL